MAAEYWVMVIVAVLVALVAGFLAGRMSAPGQRRIHAMEEERDAARREVEEVRAEVTRHFEDSARMFGKLASDYRTFFQQFARSAQNLGLSEGRARELLHQADPSLVAGQSSGGARPQAGSHPPAGAPSAAASAAGYAGATTAAGSAEGAEAGEAAQPGPAAGPGTGEGEPEAAVSSARAAPAGAAEGPAAGADTGTEDADASSVTAAGDGVEEAEERSARS